MKIPQLLKIKPLPVIRCKSDVNNATAPVAWSKVQSVNVAQACVTKPERLYVLLVSVLLLWYTNVFMSVHTQVPLAILSLPSSSQGPF